MKLLKLMLSSIIVSCLASCGGGGKSAPAPAVPSSLPSGTKVSVNPEIEFTSELSIGSPAQAKYTNTVSGTFPVSSDETITVNMESTSSTISISFKLASGENIEFVMSDLTDLGNDGYFDEYTVDAKVDGNTVLNARGYFPGTTKPRNPRVSNPVNINRPPTEEEFNKYLVGKVFYHEETSPKPGEDKGYFVFNADGTSTWYEPKDDTDVDDEIGTWKYDYNKGDPRFTLRWDEPDGDYNLIIVKFEFTTFYEGKYQDLYEEENGKEVATNDEGFWKVLNSVPNNYVVGR